MRNHVSLRKKVYLVSLAILLGSVNVYAQQNEETSLENNGNDLSPLKSVEILPRYKGEGSFFLGFRLVDIDESSRAGEFVEDKSSLTFGINGIACPLPHRYHIHGEYLGPNDFYGDFGYAYKDVLLFRNILVGVHHNLDHFQYVLPGAQPVIAYQDRNPWEENFVDFLKNEWFFRLKAPEYPLHTFFRHKYVEREGSIEERFLIGDYSRITKVSHSRKIDWASNDLTLGMNSHLGPVEIEYAYSQGKFDPGSNNVLYDVYPPSIFGRPGDTYPHTAFPETEFYGNQLKFHSSYTGQIVASATISNSEYTNQYSNTEEKVWKAAFDLRWIPDPVISVFLKYRHLEQDKENPRQVTLSGQATQITYPVRNLVSTNKDVVSLSARYRPLTSVTLIGKYEYELRERADVDAWQMLPDDSTIHRLSLAAHARPMDKLKLKGIYDYHHYENPSYNTVPDNLNRLRLKATYTPATWATAYFDYVLTLSERDELRYHNATPRLVLTGGEREDVRHHFIGSLAFTFSPAIFITTSWAYQRWKVEQDLAYALWSASGLPYYDRSAPYMDESNTFSLGLVYMLRKDLTLTADLSYTIAKGEYSPADVIQGVPSALASFSSMDTEETVVTVELAKKVFDDWEVSLKFQGDFYNDKFSDDGVDHQDGELYITTVALKRYF